MGQNVNYLLGGQSQILGADPELYRQQLIQQEQQRIGSLAPNLQLGAQLGTLLGRGITNVAQGRGFMEVTNPVLQKLTQIQDVYNTSLKNSDPNDPLSFYTNLQKNFAEQGLGQQAMMASVEAKKFEDMGLKSEQLKTQVYKENPQLLDAQIAKARDAGDDTTANRLAEQRGQIQIKIDTDRAKEVADINYKNAATAAQRAQAGKLAQDIETGKFDWKVINDAAGIPVSMAKIDKRTGATTYEPIPGSASAVGGGTAPATPAGKKANPADFAAKPTAASAPVPNAAPVAATPVAPGQAVNSNTPSPLAANGQYNAAYDPVFLGIQQAIQQEPTRLASDPEFMAAITKARNDRVEQLRKQYGNMVNFTGVL